MRAIQLVAFSLLLWTATAAADVLFIDLNNAKEEVAAAREAALKRGEKFYVLPTISPEHQQRVIAADRARDQAEKEEKRVCGGPGGSSEECKTAKRELALAESAVRAVDKTLPQVNQKNLSRAFAKLNEKGVNLSSVIISGHDGNRLYYGRFGEVNEKAIEKAFADNKPLCDNVRSIYLWGCYTATTDDFIRGWKSGCPNTSMMAGFSGQSPASHRPANGIHLKQLLLKEQELLATRDKNELATKFLSLDHVRDMKSAICLDREIVVSRKGARTVDDEIQACFNLNDKEREEHAEVFKCFRDARPGCERVSDDLSKGPLRRVYDYFQETGHCVKAYAEYNKRNPGNPRQWPITPYAVRRVLFDNNVRKNFEKHHKAELAEFNALLDELGVDPKLRMKGLANMNRKQHLDTIRGLQRAFRQLETTAKDANGRWTDSRVLAMGYSINELVKVEKGECIPLSWVEPVENLSESRCKIRQGLQGAREKAREIVGD